ncbi:MAG: HNH endonuclease signature motif containing protein [Chloroherpetonaceae bacterium]
MAKTLCAFGCGQVANYQTKSGKTICAPSTNQCPSVRLKNSIALKKAHNQGRVKRGFTKEEYLKSRDAFEKNRGKIPFELQSVQRKRMTVIREQSNQCLICGISEWQGKPLKLELDHIDGNCLNNRRENLRALCPNGHSQTETYCGRNVKRKRMRVSDEMMLQSLKKNSSIRQALLQLGLTPKGGNYARAYNLQRSLLSAAKET